VFEGEGLLAEATRFDARPGFALLPRFWRAALWRPVTIGPNGDALALLVASGFAAQEALAAATWVAGESLGIRGLGRIAVGAPADLLVLREDPRRDLAALDSLEAVVAGGRLYPVDELRAALATQLRYFERPVVRRALDLAAAASFAASRRAFARTRSEAP
jgi:adenine deaminase